jgi:chemotaxis protein MotB
MRKLGIFITLFFFLFSNGCTIVLQRGRRSDVERIRALEDELSRLRDLKNLLQQRLSQEIKDKQVRLQMQDKGLVVTFVAEVLFDSGKAKLKKESLPILEKVARILREEVPQHQVSIEGHTDNQPIKYSPWKSNWELSAQRALSVLHYLEERGVASQRLSATGYGEYKPVASNDTPQGRQLNRRVEVVIIPLSIKKIKKELGVTEYQEEVVEEELK